LTAARMRELYGAQAELVLGADAAEARAPTESIRPDAVAPLAQAA